MSKQQQSTAIEAIPEADRNEYVLEQFRSRIDYYWLASGKNKKGYTYSRYLTIILGSVVTLITSLSASKVIEGWGMEDILLILAPVLAAMLTTIPKPINRRAISALLQRAKGTPFSRGRLQANAVACARTSGGKTPGGSRPRQVFDASLLRPSLPPFPNRAAYTTRLLGDLLIAPFWMVIGTQKNASANDFPVRRCARVRQSPQLLFFFCC